MSDPPILMTPDASAPPKHLRLTVMILVVLLVSLLAIVGVTFLLSSVWTYLGSVEVFGRLIQTQKDQIRHEAFIKMLAGCGFLMTSLLLGFGMFAWVKRKPVTSE